MGAKQSMPWTPKFIKELTKLSPIAGVIASTAAAAATAFSAIESLLSIVRSSMIQDNPILSIIEERIGATEDAVAQTQAENQELREDLARHIERLDRDQRDKERQHAELVNDAREKLVARQIEQLEKEKKDNERLQAELNRANEVKKKLEAGFQPEVLPTHDELRAAYHLHKYTPGKVHIAIAGFSGAGKSSLVNAFRGLSPKHPDAAKTGVVECTRVSARYPDADPTKPIVWYDIPGAGTINTTEWQYFNKQGLFIFDFILVVWNDRFTSVDHAIIRCCKRYNIPCYIIRSKSDMHIDNMMKEDDDLTPEAARKIFIEKTHESAEKNLLEAKLDMQRVYIVCSPALRKTVNGKETRDAIDEDELIANLLVETVERRCVSPLERHYV